MSYYCAEIIFVGRSVKADVLVLCRSVLFCVLWDESAVKAFSSIWMKNKMWGFRWVGFETRQDEDLMTARLITDNFASEMATQCNVPSLVSGSKWWGCGVVLLVFLYLKVYWGYIEGKDVKLNGESSVFALVTCRKLEEFISWWGKQEGSRLLFRAFHPLSWKLSWLQITKEGL